MSDVFFAFNVAPLGHIIPIPSQLIFPLTS